MPSKGNHASKKFIGKVREYNGVKGKTWIVDCRGHEKFLESLGKKVRQGGFDTKAKALAELEYITNLHEKKAEAAPRFVGLFGDEEKLQTIQLMEAFNKQYPEIKLHHVVEAGIKAEKERLEDETFPTLSEYINETFLPTRLNRPMGKHSPQARKKEHSLEKLFYEPLLKNDKLKDMKLNVCFKPKTNLQRILTPIVNGLKSKKTGKEIAVYQKHKRAGYIARMFQAALDDYKEISDRFPLKKFQSQWTVKNRSKPTILTNDQVRDLFAAAVANKRWRDAIPYMALIFFSGARPQEIRGEEDHRIWHWENMRKWKEKSEKSGGIIITVPDIDPNGTGYRMSKPDYVMERDLFPAGVAWLEWYFLIHKKEKALPNTGTYKASLKQWKSIRGKLGLAGQDKDGKNLWPSDAPRHLFASCVHRWRKGEKAYWLDVCAHSEDMFRKHYNNPKVTSEQAKEFLFDILPPNKIKEKEDEEAKLKAAKDAKEQHEIDLEKAKEEARSNAKKQYGTDIFRDTDEVRLGDDSYNTKLTDFYPKWFTDKYPEDEDEIPL